VAGHSFQRAPETPLVGRAAELVELDAALESALAGRVSVVLVRGEPGIGKTRLVEELVQHAADRAVVAWGLVDEDEGAPPYWPWTQVLGSLLASVGEDALGEDAATVAAVVPQIAQGAGGVVGPRDPVAARFALHQAVTNVLRRLGERRSLVLVLDDLHWADVASLELTRFVARHLAGVPVLLVATYRTVDAGASPAFDDVLASLARAPNVLQLGLAGLSEPEVRHFILQTLDAATTSARAVGALHARTEGNPFYVGELVRLMVSDRLAVGPGPGRGEVPVGVRDVLRRRVARLPPPSRELMFVASVIGRDIELGILAQATGVSELAALEAIGPAVSAGFLLEDPVAVGRLRFAHALTRDTVYGELTPLRRATLHARVAEALERHHGDSSAHLAERAEHFARAAPVLGPERGLPYVLRAAEEAQAALAHEQAEVLLRRALSLIELMPSGPLRTEHELRTQNRLAALLISTRGQADPEVGRVCARARALSRQVGQSPELVITLAKLANFHFVSGDFHVCVELGAQLLAIGEQQDDLLAATLGYFSEGYAQPYFNELPRARAGLARAVQCARQLALTEEMTVAFGAHMLPITLVYQSRYAGLAGEDELMRTAGGEAIEVARRSGHAYSIAFIECQRTLLAVLMNDAALVERYAAETIASCATGGFALLGYWCEIFHGWALCERGEPERGLPEMDAGMTGHRMTGAALNTALFLALLSDGRRQAGDADAALDLIDEAIALGAMSADRIYEADFHRRRGELLSARDPGRLADAIAALNTAATIAEAQGMVAFERRAQSVLARVAPRTGAAAAADGAAISLSPREIELLRLLASGLTDKQIAAELVISVRTVSSHLDRIRDKTGGRRRLELTRLADQLGLTGDAAQGQT
jgi:DNA-binding NarL/FixJ family response regulator